MSFQISKYIKYCFELMEHDYVRIKARYTGASPDIFIGGAMKSGTTSIYQYLNHHPEIYQSVTKEPCYFANQYHKGIQWYLSHYSPEKNKKVIDNSPVYLHFPAAAERIYKYNNRSKLIFVLRDPLERAVSHYVFYSDPKSAKVLKRPEKRDQRTIEDAFNADIQGRENRTFYRYLSCSLYFKQLSNFLKYFPGNQILLIDHLRLLHEPLQTMKQIASFMELSDTNFWAGAEINDERVSGRGSFKLENQTKRDLKLFNVQNYDVQIENELKHACIAFLKNDVRELVNSLNFNPVWASNYNIKT